jgi:hypothetical protein
MRRRSEDETWLILLWLIERRGVPDFLYSIRADPMNKGYRQEHRIAICHQPRATRVTAPARPVETQGRIDEHDHGEVLSSAGVMSTLGPLSPFPVYRALTTRNDGEVIDSIAA